MGEFVTVTTDDQGVATLRLDRAPVNALNTQIWSEFATAAHDLTYDDSVKAVVLWGGPKVFAAGADIKQMQGMTYQDAVARAGALQKAFDALARLPKPMIAAINGFALGGGCELAMTADFRYAGEDAKLGQPEIKLGVIHGAGGTQRLTRLVGVQKAREIVYDGGMYSAEESLAMGLVDKVVPAEEVYDKAVEQARRYATGPFALRMAKQAIDEGIEMDLSAALRLETSLFAACFASDDRAIGMKAFLEKGKPQFVQR